MIRAAIFTAGVIGLAACASAATPPQILPRDATTGRITFQAVVAAEGVSADDLYSRAKLWAATTYRSAKTVVDLEDRDAGRLMVKGRMTIPYAGLSSMDIRYQVLVEVKDGRFRYTLTDLELVGTGGSPTASTPFESQFKNALVGKKTLERVHIRCTEVIESLIEGMTGPNTADKW